MFIEFISLYYVWQKVVWENAVRHKVVGKSLGKMGRKSAGMVRLAVLYIRLQ